MSGPATQAFQRFAQAEIRLCRALNRCSHQVAARALFRTASRLGDGWVWYALMGWLAVAHGRDGLIVSVQMAATGAVGVLVYRLIKQCTVRERPYVSHDTIVCAIAPLDRYSFPSGHTLHAVSFTLIATHHFPVYSECLVILAVLIALSRITLGLHYPTDVAAGAMLGGLLATVAIQTGALITP